MGQGDKGRKPEPMDESLVLECAMQAGAILLANGAEISRVEETVTRMCSHYGVESEKAFVLSNGLFMTAGSEREAFFARVQHIPVQGARLDLVAAVNQLSRRIEEGRYSIEEVQKKLNEIEQMPRKRAWVRTLASGAGSGCFCFMFGGSLLDCAGAFLAGLILYIYVWKVYEPYLSKIIGNIGGGALVSVMCILLYRLHLGEAMDQMIIGAIMPLVPGIAFTNGVRDIADGDYIAGSVRLLDALLVFVCIAVGVGLVITAYHRLTGGMVL